MDIEKGDRKRFFCLFLFSPFTGLDLLNPEILLFFFSITVDMQCYIGFRSMASWSDIYVICDVISPTRLVPVWHRARLSQYYRLYPQGSPLIPHDYFVAANLCFFPPSPFHPAPHAPRTWQPSVCSLYLCICFRFVFQMPQK